MNVYRVFPTEEKHQHKPY